MTADSAAIIIDTSQGLLNRQKLAQLEDKDKGKKSMIDLES